MKRDGRLSRVLHLLLHLAQRGQPLTSEALARSAGTNPVVIRRILAGLRDRGILQSEPGHGGGWTLRAEPGTVTLLDVHHALGAPDLIVLGTSGGAQGCRVEAAVDAELEDASREAELLLLARFGEVTLQDLLDRID